MSAREFDRWIAYDRIEPIGAWRSDLQTALIATILANAHRDPKRRPYKITDFWLFKPKTEADPEELFTKFVAAAGVSPEAAETEPEAAEWPPLPDS